MTGFAVAASPAIIGIIKKELVTMALRISLLTCDLSSWIAEIDGNMTDWIELLMLFTAKKGKRSPRS